MSKRRKTQQIDVKPQYFTMTTGPDAPLINEYIVEEVFDPF